MSGDVVDDEDDDGLYISCMMMVWISAVLLLQLSLVQHQLHRQSQAGLASARFNFSFKLSHHTNTHYNWQSLLHFDYLHCKIWNNIDNIKYKSNPYFLNFSFSISSLHIYHTLWRFHKLLSPVGDVFISLIHSSMATTAWTASVMCFLLDHLHFIVLEKVSKMSLQPNICPPQSLVSGYRTQTDWMVLVFSLPSVGPAGHRQDQAELRQLWNVNCVLLPSAAGGSEISPASRPRRDPN